MNDYKKEIGILAQKFGYKVSYKGRERSLEKDSAILRIGTGNNKASFIMWFSISMVPYELVVSSDALIDKVWSFMNHDYQNLTSVPEKGDLITLEEYLLSERENGRRSIEALKKELKEHKISHYRLFGNRIEVEYYNGYLILNDDIRFLKTNVIPFKEF